MLICSHTVAANQKPDLGFQKFTALQREKKIDLSYDKFLKIHLEGKDWMFDFRI